MAPKKEKSAAEKARRAAHMREYRLRKRDEPGYREKQAARVKVILITC